MRTSPEGADAIRSYEGLRLTAYLDSGGVPTIGYGHTGPDVTHYDVDIGTTIDERGAEELFLRDLRQREIPVSNLLRCPVSQCQFDALMSFAFNVGLAEFASSHVLIAMLAGKPVEVAAELARWHHVKGKDDEGLARRRGKEIYMFAGGRP